MLTGLMRRRLIIPGLLVAGLLTAAPARAASITFESLTVSPNDFFTISIGITDVVDLYTFGFDITFDPAVVSTPTVTRGNIFDVGGALGECDIDICFFPGISDPIGSPGVVSFILDSLIGQVPGVSGSGTLALLTFQALAGGGNANIALSNVLLVDSFGGTIDDVTIQDGVITVTPPTPIIPEPSTLGLLGVGLAALARRLRRKAPVAS